ncbi:hypothetical protein [Bacillus ndiopicus]|uniref:hypothetical protein n=1 Tax=Bacillus ndiopicus TaxID=1347368 RepID=UPI0005AAAF3E|nr:hypothetical protein [Bacillus ndiopicus]
MKIIDVATEFVEHYEPTTTYLEQYFARNKEHFEEYFTYHCHNKEQKMEAALTKHPLQLQAIRAMALSMPALIKEITDFYETAYNIQFTQNTHLLVGIYGSNAYTYRQFIPEIAFCLEKLSAQEEHLKVIIAHEFGHATHNLISLQEKINWQLVDWGNPYIWLLQEGVATYFSMKAVQAHEDVYFVYYDDPQWLVFCQENEQNIIEKFRDDLQQLSAQNIFKEWFSINGGTRFGYTRLAYYIGYRCVQELVAKYGELEAVTLWKTSAFQKQMQEQLALL